jgi:pimeloyl-ACP methyl ester carboxylesterase
MVTPAQALWSRWYDDSDPFEVETEDGIRLEGSRVGEAGPTLVFCHGLLGWHRKPKIVRFVKALSQSFVVYAVDLRGHGGSGGECTYGDLEVLDVEAVVNLGRKQRPEEPLVTVGTSMGGVAVVRHAALRGGVEAVVSISTPSRWDGHTSRAVKQMQWVTGTPAGRRLAEQLGVRLSDHWDRPETPEDLVERIAPIPLIVVHGRDDHFFDEEEAWRLYRRAGQPKRLLLASKFGHADDGLTPKLAARLEPRIMEALYLR